MDPKEIQDDTFLESGDGSLLRRVEAVVTAPSDGLFASMVSCLGDILEARYALVGEVIDGARVRALAWREPQGGQAGIEWDIADSACAELVDDRPRHYESGARAKFPQ